MEGPAERHGHRGRSITHTTAHKQFSVPLITRAPSGNATKYTPPDPLKARGEQREHTNKTRNRHKEYTYTVLLHTKHSSHFSKPLYRALCQRLKQKRVTMPQANGQRRHGRNNSVRSPHAHSRIKHAHSAPCTRKHVNIHKRICIDAHIRTRHTQTHIHKRSLTRTQTYT